MTSHPRTIARSIVALAVVSVLALAGCSAGGGGEPDPVVSEEAEPQSGGNMNVQLPSDPQSLDLVTVNTPSNGAIAAMIYDHLFERDEQFQPQPNLITDYDISDDGLVYTFHLRPEVTWHDGDPLTADDVVASLTRWTQKSGAGRTAAPTIDAIRAEDEHTVVIDLNTRRFGFEHELSAAGTEIYKASILAAAPDTGIPRDQTIGTGPYMLAKASDWDSQKIVLTRYEDYVPLDFESTGNAGAKHAYLDTVTFIFAGEDNAIVSGLVSGLWDLGTPSNDQFEVLQSEPGINLVKNAGANINTFAVNMAPSSVFSDIKARQALNLVTDKSALIAATGGQFDLVVPNSAFAPEDRVDLFSDEGRDVYDQYDPKEAKRLFAEAGVNEGDHIRIVTTNTFPQIYQWAVLLQDQLADIGIVADLQVYDYAAMLAFLQEQPDAWDMTMLAFNGQIPTPATANMLTRPWGSFQTDELKALIKDYSNSLTPDEARDAVDALQGYLWENLSQIVISHAKTWTALSDRVEGYVFGRMVANAWIPEDRR